jgi:spore maturation protein CgeB
MPQIKGRTFEAAFSKSIILHKFDKWNVIEDWFVPNEDFIYFTDEKDLEEKIYEILKNYDGYKYIAENAYNKAMNKYTTESFIKNYILSNTKI